MCGIAGVLDVTGERADVVAAHRRRDGVGDRTTVVPTTRASGAIARQASRSGSAGCRSWTSPRRAISRWSRRAGGTCIVFNGEIYNHLELRARLEALGHGFRGRSDTEVLLAAVTEWGARGALDHVNGMFAYALWDRRGAAAASGPGPGRREAPVLRPSGVRDRVRLGAEGVPRASRLLGHDRPDEPRRVLPLQVRAVAPLDLSRRLEAPTGCDAHHPRRSIRSRSRNRSPYWNAGDDGASRARRSVRRLARGRRRRARRPPARRRPSPDAGRRPTRSVPLRRDRLVDGGGP